MWKQRKKSSLLVLLVTLTLTMPPLVNAIGWSGETRLTTHSSWDGQPSIAQIDNGDIWLVWQAKRSTTLDIYYKIHFNDNGTWSLDRRLPRVPLEPERDDIGPCIIQSHNGTMWVFWAMNRTWPMIDYDIVYRQSNDYGLTWSNTFSVTNSLQVPSDAYNDKGPSVLEASDGDLWVVWARTTSPGNDEIFYKVNHAGSWTSEVQLTNYPGFDRNPSIVQARNGSIMIFWSKYVGATDYDIVYRAYNGTDWGPERNLTQTPTWLSSDPSAMLARNGTLWVFWSAQDVIDPETDTTLFYKTSNNNGDTWSSTIKLVYDLSYNAQPSATQGSDKKIWVAWVSNRDANFDVYYKTSDQILYHDVAITGISLSETSVYQGTNILVTVNATNKGDYTETLNVKCYANQTLIGTQATPLAGGTSTSLVFPWDTSTFTPGTYYMKATVDPVPNENVINFVDNTLISDPMLVRILGDINADGRVDADDLSRLSAALGSTPGQSTWDQECDINANNIVDVNDLYILSSNYGITV